MTSASDNWLRSVGAPKATNIATDDLFSFAENNMESAFEVAPILRRVAPHLSKRFFTCQALQASGRSVSTRNPVFASPLIRSLRANTARKGVPVPLRTHSRTAIQSRPVPASLRASARYNWLSLATGSRQSSSPSSAISASFFPETSSRSTAFWLLASAASVYGIVVFGGLTRLTESGLSITEWRPVTGSIPPRTQEDWESEFGKYRESPEYKLLNPQMNLDEFKTIYWMEWTHRLWGRMVGLTFVLPALYFVARRKVSKRMTLNLAAITGLIGLQGFIGWWMVKSGLKDDLFAPGSHPRVSQYRLTAHLGTAFVCYLAMLWSGLGILREHKALKNPEKAMARMKMLRSPVLKSFRRGVTCIAILVFVTAMSGGLVAGLDAGLIYNEFPWMGNGLTPPKSELLSDFYCKRADRSDLVWRNVLENPSLVQLDHRILATTTFSAIMGLWAYSRLSPVVKMALPRNLARGVHGLVGFVWLQAALGITTLLYLVPIHAASSHQAGALALLSMATIMVGRGHVSKRTATLVAARLQAVKRGYKGSVKCVNTA